MDYPPLQRKEPPLWLGGSFAVWPTWIYYSLPVPGFQRRQPNPKKVLKDENHNNDDNKREAGKHSHHVSLPSV
jgi:hypothetical protein